MEKPLFEGHPALIYSVGQWFLVVLTAGIAYIVYWFKSRSIAYEITSQRIRIEGGLLSKIKENVVPDLEHLADTLRECALKERKRRRITTPIDA